MPANTSWETSEIWAGIIRLRPNNCHDKHEVREMQQQESSVRNNMNLANMANYYEDEKKTSR